MSQVKFGHRLVFTLLEESAIEREWRGSDGVSRSSFFQWVPRPAVGRYRKALEAMGTSTEKGKECLARFSSYEDVVADAIREAYLKVGHMEGNAGDRLNTEFKRHLDDQLYHYLAPLLETRGQKFCVDLVERGEHEFRVTIDAEKGSYNHSLPGSYSLYWAVTMKVTIVEVDTLEEAAGLAVAKALGFGGSAMGKVDQLDIPGRIKEVILRFLALPKMEIERNDLTGPSQEEGVDEVWANDFLENPGNEIEAAVNDWAMGNVIDPEAPGDEGDGGEGDGGEGDVSDGDVISDEDDFPVMTSRWSGQMSWLEEDDEEEEGEDEEPDQEEERVGEAQGEDEAD